MSRDWFDVALASKEIELKKNALVSFKYEPLQECHDLHVSTF